MRDHRELFRIKRGGRDLRVAARGRFSTRRYVGFIDGHACAEAREKGEVLRLLIEMTATRAEAL